MNRILQGDCLEVLKGLPDQSVNCCVTSPPYYGLRDYEIDGQIGLEDSIQEYIDKLVIVFREVRRVLTDDGTLWLNLGDSYSNGGRKTRDPDNKLSFRSMSTRPDDGMRPKNLLGIPWRTAFALQEEGWNLRSDIIWNKVNSMPSSVSDRPVSSHEFVFLFTASEDDWEISSHEYVFLLTKMDKYFYDWKSIATPPCDSTMKDKRPKGVIRQRVNKNSKYHEGCDKKIAQQFKKQDGVGRSDYTGFNARYTPVDLVRRRDVWSVTSIPSKIPHYAIMNPKVAELCILAGCPEGGFVLDPFIGSGTTGLVALKLNRHYLGIELNPEYIKQAEQRLSQWQYQTRLTGVI